MAKLSEQLENITRELLLLSGSRELSESDRLVIEDIMDVKLPELLVTCSLCHQPKDINSSRDTGVTN